MHTINSAVNKQKQQDEDSSLTSALGGRGAFLLHLADSALILSQRNAEWCGHGPILEQDIAITNIALDLLGQARNFYQYAALLINQQAGVLPENDKAAADSAGADYWTSRKGTTEDSLAYLRTEREFKNLLITELPRGDWAQTILRQFVCSAYQYSLYGKLQKNNDEQLAAIAEKSIKETAYHVKWSSEWVVRMGDGTAESNKRINKAIENLWVYTGEFFIPEDYEKQLISESYRADIKQEWLLRINKVFKEATLSVPGDSYMQTGGKRGNHTEHLGFILAEMQYLQRTYPGAEW